MMAMLLETVLLDQRARNHVAYVLQNGRELAQLVLQHVDLLLGEVMVIVPKGIPTQELYEFARGGKLPTAAESTWRHLKDGSRMIPVLTTRGFVSEQLAERLAATEVRMLVFESFCARRTDPNLGRRKSKLVFYFDSVYHFVTADQASPEAVEVAMLESVSLPFFWGVISSLPLDSVRRILETREFTRSDLNQIAIGCETLVVGVYDGETYLLWQKSATRHEVSQPKSGRGGESDPL